jgi:hypothetical protein
VVSDSPGKPREAGVSQLAPVRIYHLYHSHPSQACPSCTHHGQAEDVRLSDSHYLVMGTQIFPWMGGSVSDLKVSCNHQENIIMARQAIHGFIRVRQHVLPEGATQSFWKPSSKTSHPGVDSPLARMPESQMGAYGASMKTEVLFTP